MSFKANPLSLSVPEPAFESWLRDSGYLEILDQRTSDLHHTNSSTPSTKSSTTAKSSTTPSTISHGFVLPLLSHIGTLLSLFTLNPLSKLTTHDFSGDTPSWTLAFVASFESYSFPSSPSQARLRVHENVKRYARNYATLFIVFFACSLYQIPLALAGLIASLALWDIYKFCGDRWGLDHYPVMQKGCILTAQFFTAVIIFWFNVPLALFCATGVGYAVMILHASFRKLTPAKYPTRRRSK